jgi:hypothetical protein
MEIREGKSLTTLKHIPGDNLLTPVKVQGYMHRLPCRRFLTVITCCVLSEVTCCREKQKRIYAQ